MRRKVRVDNLHEGKKQFYNIFRELCTTRNDWEVWADLMTVMACSISNAVDRSESRYDSREREYKECIKRLGSVDKPAQLFAIIINVLDDNPDQDFLGSLYMELQLGNHWKGQFFTPYSISRLMAEIAIGDCQKQIDKDGWISVCDPCIGGGAMLLAAANTIRRKKINYQNHVLFVGQDIDRVVGMMAYIQISLLGCPGYIVIGNSLSNPLIGEPLVPVEQSEQEFWYTPMYCNDVWHWRRIFNSFKCNIDSGTVTTKKTVEKEHFYMFFDFKEQEEKRMEDRVLQKGISAPKISEKSSAVEADMEVLEKKQTEPELEKLKEKADVADSAKKIYSTGADKLQDEEKKMLESVKAEHKVAMQAQLDHLFKELIEQTKQDSEFEKNVLLSHKSIERCMKFCSDKAMGIREPSDKEKAAARNNNVPIVTPVGSDMLFRWIQEYYKKDDKDEVEKEAKKKAEEKKRTSDAKKKADAREAAVAKKKKEQEEKKKAEVAKKKEETQTSATKKKEMENQLSIFDLMGV